MAASWGNLDANEAQKFQDTFDRLLHYSYGNDEKSKSTLSLLLDEIVSVDVSLCSPQSSAEESELLGNLGRQVPFHQELLVAKTCRVIFVFCAQKNTVLKTPDLHSVIQFLIDGLLRCQSFVHADILSALRAVCNGNTQRLQKYHDILFGARGLLLQLTDDTSHNEEVVVEAVKCISTITYNKGGNIDFMEVHYLSACLDTLVHLLHRVSQIKITAQLQSKLLINCFTGIQNIVLKKRLPNIELGTLFAAVRAYMFFGLTSHTINVPAQLYPHAFTPFDPLQSKPPTIAKTDVKLDEGKTRKDTDGPVGRVKGKRSRKKKGRGGGDGGGEEASPGARDSLMNAVESCYANSNIAYGPSWSNVTPENEVESWESKWLKVNSSDSEFSDTEGGKAQEQRAEAVRVRQSALNCFLSIVKVIDKKVMFGFWSSFIPAMDTSDSPPQFQSLFTTILKDPSPKCRMAGVASLICMLESTRPYLAVAEDISTSTQQPAFTSLSAVLGSMVREVHRRLLQALVAEEYKAVITQIIKCLGSLVSNAPYHRLNPGLLTKVLKHIRHFFAHKDPNVRTACLTCIGSIVGIKPPLMEISELIKPPRPPVGVGRKINPGDSPLLRPEDAAFLLYPVFSVPKVPILTEETESDEKEKEEKNDGGDMMSTDGLLDSNKKDKSIAESLSKDDGGLRSGGSDQYDEGDVKRQKNVSNELRSRENKEENLNSSSLSSSVGKSSKEGKVDNMPTNDNVCESLKDLLLREGEASSPAEGGAGSPHFGSDTPVFTDQLLQAHARETSWVIKLCLKSVQGQSELAKDASGSKSEPLPIRLEALQVMSNLIKNYFPIIRQSVRLLQELVQICFDDPSHIVILHGTKVLDELTQALERDVNDAKIAPAHVIPIQQIKDFWLQLLTGPLPPLLAFNPALSQEGNNLVRSGACECLANVGDQVFTLLPMRKQMQCVTLVLGLARDEDKLIQASAVRALGIYVGYSELKEDLPFIMDAGQAILACMASSCNSVRLKASWAMANLCDKLVNNKDSGVPNFVADFPDSLLLSLVQSSGVAIKDSDKISCNAARAIGNLLRYLPEHCFQSPDMLAAIEVAVRGLVKNMNSGAMKVRWNCCYAASNIFQNASLPQDLPWITDILTMLAKVVQNCSNFKVRINAALGLAAPTARLSYGCGETVAHIWGSLVTALETAENINDFAEYRYKDSLISHICGAALHLTSLLQLSDLSALHHHVHVKRHSFRTYMEKYITLTEATKGIKGVPSVPEVRKKLLELQAKASTDEHRRCLQALIEASVPEPDDSEEKTEKSFFQQVYD